MLVRFALVFMVEYEFLVHLFKVLAIVYPCNFMRKKNY